MLRLLLILIQLVADAVRWCGLVLRPVPQNMKFSGADIARNQGTAKIFTSMWTFKVK
jgi:hypothetical protein